MENDESSERNLGAPRTATPSQPSQPPQPSVPATPLAPTSTPIRFKRPSGDLSLSCSEQSFLQSRLGHGTIESILDSQEKLKKEDEAAAAVRKVAPPLGSMDYFSEPEMTSPQGSRPPSPVLSDTGTEVQIKVCMSC